MLKKGLKRGFKDNNAIKYLALRLLGFAMLIP